MSREILDFNRDWRFHRGEDFRAEALSHGTVALIANETQVWQKADNHALSKADNPHVDAWRAVDLPHDFVLEGPFTAEAPCENGSLRGGVAWYVKKFHLPASDDGRRIHIEFDGVYRDSMLFCNGHSIGRHLSGYTSFTFDLTEVCAFGGDNAIAVRVDASQNELWSYDGGGVYRAVRLVKTAPVHIPAWGVHVRTGGSEAPGATRLAATVRNATYTAAAGVFEACVLNPAGCAVAKASQPFQLAAISEATLDISAQVEAPRLWQLEDPALYRLILTLHIAGHEVDRVELTFGFRYFHFDPATGFHLNGAPLKLKGLCCHQDHAGVGVAVPPALQAWGVARLKELGCNALRTSHNPPDPALLEACDQLGMLVMDEIRVPGATGERLADVERLIRRDRNHPSVIMWSLGNEEMGLQGQPAGVRILQRLHHLAKRLDPDRPTTYAMNWLWLEWCEAHHEAGGRFDVFGANYRTNDRSESYDLFHARHPDWPLIGTETGGSGSTRGLYEPDVSDTPVTIGKTWQDYPAGWTQGGITRPFASAYGNWHAWWGYSVEQTWQDCVQRPFLAGTFLWTGFDYRGETAPYGWPAVITRFGILDYCGFYKEVAHYLRAWWRPDVPHLFLMPHWDWQGHEGESIPVWCYGNTACVELFLNGQSLGRQDMPVNGRLEWDISYAPGELKAIGCDANGRGVLSFIRRTAGAPAAIRLWRDPAPPAPAGEGAIFVLNAAIVDAAGEVCPRAADEVTFAVAGPARILGVGNGNPLSHEPDLGTPRRKAYHGLCQVILQSTGSPGTLRVRATATGLLEDTFDICTGS